MFVFHEHSKQDDDFSMVFTFSIKAIKMKVKKTLIENRLHFTKTHFQDFFFRINFPEVCLTKNDRRTFDFIENDIFQNTYAQNAKKAKKTNKNMANDMSVLLLQAKCEL